MLDMTQSESGPVVYFYCLSNPTASPSDASYNAFAAAHHVVLDSSIPFAVVEVSLSAEEPGDDAHRAHPGGSAPAKAPQSYASKDTHTTNGTASTRATLNSDFVSPASQPEDDFMSMSVM
jgi:hypothetical protein